MEILLTTYFIVAAVALAMLIATPLAKLIQLVMESYLDHKHNNYR